MVLARCVVYLSLTVLVAASHAGAQASDARRPIELGLDAALSYESSDLAKVTSLTVPVSAVRVGFFVGDAVSIEPFGSIRYTHIEFEDEIFDDESSSFTSYDFGVGLLYQFSSDRARAQPFIRPFVGLSGVRGDDESETQPIAGATIGFRPAHSGRLTGRFELGLRHRFEDEPLPSRNEIFLSFGISFFTR